MRRIIPTLFAAAIVGAGATAWSQLSAGGRDPRTHRSTPLTDTTRELRGELTKARRCYSMEDLNSVIGNARKYSDNAPQDAGIWHVLAEAHLERAQQRIHLRGLNVGQPFFTELPEEFQEDLNAGLAAVAQAQRHGDDSCSIHWIKGLLLSHQITSVITALRYSGAINRALNASSQRDGEDPGLQNAMGLRKLLSPQFFGHDPGGALKHFQLAARNGDDERASVYASMACYLQGQQASAIEWLERAITANPANVFAKTVLLRLRQGEDNAFGRDVTQAEVDAAK